MAGPVIEGKRFWPFRWDELFDYQSYQVQEFIRGCGTPRVLADKVIRAIEYPFYQGRPDDLHILNCYHGKWCRRIDLDFWQKASETAAIGIGDCEDGTFLFVAGARAMGVPEDKVYATLGAVQDVRTGEIIGYHAWAVIEDPSFGDGWRYVESTLDVPPKEYKPVEDIRKPYVSGVWRLIPEILGNDRRFEVIEPSLDVQASMARFMAKRRKTRFVKVGYLEATFREKETREKYRALEKIWGIRAKPLRRAGLLSRLRWR